MAFVPVPPSTAFRLVTLVVSCALALPALAQQTPRAAAQAENPGMVIARTVNPRIAYRGIPTGDNPIHSEATLFPARTFHAAVNGVVGELVDDAALGARGSAGLGAGASTDMAVRRVLGATPLGAGADGRAATTSARGIGGAGALGGTAVGGAVGRAVGGNGGGGLFGTLPAMLPTRQGGGQ